MYILSYRIPPPPIVRTKQKKNEETDSAYTEAPRAIWMNGSSKAKYEFCKAGEGTKVPSVTKKNLKQKVVGRQMILENKIASSHL